MFLKKISLGSFKNIEHAALEFTSPLCCFVGSNGAGKTNIIDAVHFLSMGRSAFTMTDQQCVNHSTDYFLLDGQYESADGKKETVVCSFKKGSGKTLKRNGKPYDKLSDHIGFIPIVIVSPGDSALITDEAAERRRYMNLFASQLDKGYLVAATRYNQLLGSRNKLLKEPGAGSAEIMEVLDMQLCDAAAVIHKGRAELVSQLAPLVEEYYRELSGDRERIELSYRSELNDTPLQELLERNAERDRVNQHTTSGVHRDDLRMRIAGYPLRKYGSQGQQKSFLISLKLAQHNIIAQRRGENPILLLDDLFDKLDNSRVERLLKVVSGGNFGQIFITDCNRSRLESVLERGGLRYSLFEVSQGQVSHGELSE